MFWWWWKDSSPFGLGMTNKNGLGMTGKEGVGITKRVPEMVKSVGCN